MGATPDREVEIVGPGEVDGGSDVGAVLHSDEQGRVLVDEAVPEGAGVTIPVVIGKENVAGSRFDEGSELVFGKFRDGSEWMLIIRHTDSPHLSSYFNARNSNTRSDVRDT